MRPNIIYFNPDELRADVLGCYGHTLPGLTPNLDRFAREAVRFSDCFVQNTVCTPSRCSFMTGTYPHNRGHRSLYYLLHEDEDNTLKYLKDSGYDVHVFGKNDLFSPAAQRRSVSQLHKVAGGAAAQNLYRYGELGYYSFLYRPLRDQHSDYYKMQEVVEFIHSRQQNAAPYMLFLAFSLPHCPYTVPEPWYSKYRPEDVPDLLPLRTEGAPAYMTQIRHSRQLDQLGDMHFRKIMAVYLGMVSYVDHLFGMLLEALKQSRQNTALFVFSDHGDWAGDYGLVEKWPSGTDDRLTRVPMLVQTPGCRAGHLVAEPIECFDLMATTLELAGIEARHSHFSRSMVPQLAGAAGDAHRAVFCEGGYDLPGDLICSESFEGYPGRIGTKRPAFSDPKHIYHPKSKLQGEHPHTVCRSAMIRTAQHKLVIRSRDHNELYDMAADPGELCNRYDNPAYSEIQKNLEQRMLQWYLTTADTAPWDRDARGWSAM